MINNESKNYIALCTTKGLRAWIKTADYTSSITGTTKQVITALIITPENSIKPIFEHIDTQWISYYNSNDGYSIVDIIEDVLLYMSYNSNEYNFNSVMYDVVSNGFRGLQIIKNFKRDHLKRLEDNRIIEENRLTQLIVNNIKEDIQNTLNYINKYIPMRYNPATGNNNYIHELRTINSIKKFATNYNNRIEEYTNILNFLNEYLRLLQNDFIPENFLKFDYIA